MLILVTYDIDMTSKSGAGRLRKVAKKCQDYGIRVQNSVFECVVDTMQYTVLKHDLLKIIDLKMDSLRFYRLGEKYSSKVEHFGAKFALRVEEPLVL
jgi:CRISPR-associated protein Cas2